MSFGAINSRIGILSIPLKVTCLAWETFYRQSDDLEKIERKLESILATIDTKSKLHFLKVSIASKIHFDFLSASPETSLGR